jgi:hypothetical protein
MHFHAIYTKYGCENLQNKKKKLFLNSFNLMQLNTVFICRSRYEQTDYCL